MTSRTRRWQQKLQDLLNRLGWSQTDFAMHTEVENLRLTGSPLLLSTDTVSLYLRKNNPRLPGKRQRYVELVDFFVIYGAITTVDEANEWLAMVDHTLTEREKEQIFFAEGTLLFDGDDLPPRILRQIRDIILARGGHSAFDKDIWIRFRMDDIE